jgi:hypothetical protein
VSAATADEHGLTLTVPEGLVPEGGRRAGLTAHEFFQRMIGQEQRVHTGWLSHEAGGPVRYSPHTKAGYRLPRSNLAFILGSASLATRMQAARKAGVAPGR